LLSLLQLFPSLKPNHNLQVLLTDPKTLRDLLSRHGIAPRKGLGQHFLCSGSAVNAVVTALDGYKGVLEIGPGPGVLTSPLSEKVEKLIALEIDGEMVNVLKESAPKADVRRVDALKTDLAEILNELPQPRAIVSNLPYYITAPLVTAIARSAAHLDKAVLMMQKEVARRILAKAGERERGSLSVYLQATFEIKKLADVPAGAFIPPPKVDSTILQFRPIRGATYSEEFFAFIRQGFDQPRKTLANNVAEGGVIERGEVEAGLRQLGLDERIRPHQVSLEEWIALARMLIGFSQ
jgi:16S rRNA (adenine1518-N6/adenine1519-N6)-dimethyltransferase